MSTISTFQTELVALPQRSTARLWLTYASLFAADLIAISVAGTLAVMMRFLMHGAFRPADWLVYAPALLIFFQVFAMVGLYPGIAISPIDEFRLVLRAASIVSLILAGGAFFLRHGLFSSRIVFLLAWLLTVLLVPACRRAVRGVCALQPWWGIPAVIMGEPDHALMMYHMLKGHARLGLRPVALLLDDPWASPAACALREKVFVGTLAQASPLSQLYGDCYAIIAMPSTGSARLANIFTRHLDGFHRVLILPDLFGTSSLHVSAKDICGMLTLQIEQRLSRRLSQWAKRSFDLAVCTALIISLLPLFLVLCLAIKLSSRGPIFYGHWRIGRNERRFRVWKFRTMIVNADAELERRLAADPELKKEWEAEHKLRRDPRITAVGQFLRRSSIDEIPQLWNVLMGEMSLVGPRPITPHEIEKYGSIFHQYRRVIPGITGLWQVSGRNNVPYARRVEIDDYYVRNWSFALDLYILMRTCRTVAFSEGAC
jgi:Undecaprenyl-phosphate galactose phosphotransferase WbaP